MSFLDLYQGDIDEASKIQPNEGTRLPSEIEENFNAAWSDGLLFSQSVARENARASVLSDYVSEIRQKTGQDMSNEMFPDVAGGGQIGVTNFDQANARVATLKQDYPDLDLAPLSEDEIDRRALAKAQAAHRTYETLQAGEKTWEGSVGSFFGSAGSAFADPINILGMAVAPEAQGISVLSSALRWGALAGVSQAAIEFSSDQFKEQVQPGYQESGAPLQEIGGAFLGGAALGGGIKALGNAWTRVKTGAWPTSVRDAGNVIESEANVAQTNIFPGVEGEVAHREALVKTIDDILAGRPVDVSQHITPDFLERSQSLVEKLQGEQPMRLPVINQRAIELIAEQERLSTRDTELASTLEKLPPGDASAADRLNRLQAVEQQIAATNDIAEKRALNERRDQILVDTNPEALQAAAAPFEARRVAEAERTSISDRLDQIIAEHANLQASTLPQMQLPALGQRERIPGAKPEQLTLPLEPATAETVPPEAPRARVDTTAPQPALQTADEMAKTLTAPDHQDAIRADIDRARAMGDVQVPGMDENGNHTMLSVDKAMDQVDAYKKLAEQIQVCANPVQEAAE
jgi:hypothetical protein